MIEICERRFLRALNIISYCYIIDLEFTLSPSMLVYTQRPVPHHRTTAVISAMNFINPFNFYVILFIFRFARTRKLKENCYK